MSEEVFRKFVLEHSADDPARLILNRNKWPDVDVNAAATAIECRRKIRTKLPEWYAEAGIVYPDRICAEQSSSSATAEYKARVAAGIISRSSPGRSSVDGKVNELEGAAASLSMGGRVADLTGGLGVDSLAFSRVASRVLYNEMNSERAEAARHNFTLLGAGNIEIISHCVQPEDSLSESGVADSCSFWAALREFRPDLVYMDPARRSATGGKVFLLEDCSPDVLTLLPGIFSIVPDLLLKLSPMADISMLVRRLAECGAGVREVHVVASAGECKELLLWVRPDTECDTTLIVNENGHILSFPASAFGNGSAIESSGTECASLFLDGSGWLRSMQYLFEPGKALSKAGLFNAVCTLFSGQPSVGQTSFGDDHSSAPQPYFHIVKAGRSTHLYFIDSLQPVDDAVVSSDERVIPDIRNFGKIFRILEAAPLDRQSIKAFSTRYPKAEVSARNIPMTSDELRKRLKVSSGGDVHIFGLRMDFSSAPSANYLIAATRGAL